MKKILVVAIFGISIQSYLYSAEGDTTKFNFYKKYDIQQWKGSWWYKKFDYIDPAKTYKKAFLSIKLGCASYGCCVWDYAFHAYIVKPMPGYDTAKYAKKDTVIGNSVTVVLDSLWINRKSDNYEVGRLITPYGTYMRANSNGFSNNNWQHPYVYDVTDYLPLLKDSFGVGIVSGGYDGKKGFSMTVDLILIEGPSNYQPSQIFKPYQKSYGFQNELQIDTITKAFKFKLKSGETNAKFKTIITGHGQDGEFSPITYKVKLNSSEIYSKRLWNENCDKTYIQPQGGTWIFSRCNWCPGEKVETFDIDLSPHLIPTDSNEIDITLVSIENSAASYQANYDIMGHIITYAKRDSADLSIDEVIAPSKDPNHILSNALCQGPIVRLRNNGTKSAKKAYIDYWVDPTKKTTYIWNGILNPDQSILVSLPAFPWDGVNSSAPFFYASLQKTLENMVVWNDTISSSFTIPPVYNLSILKMELRTTNESINTNKLSITNELGIEVFKKDIPTNGAIIIDTVSLPEGCYRLELTDYESRIECGDGLNFWWSNQQLGKSPGSFRILNGGSNAVIKTFNPDFGGKINHQFTVNKKIGEFIATSTYAYQAYKFPDTIKKDTVKKDTIKKPNGVQALEKSKFHIFPNPTIDKSFTINLPSGYQGETNLSIQSLDGRILYYKAYKNEVTKDFIRLPNLIEGTYIISLEYEDRRIEEKLIIK